MNSGGGELVPLVQFNISGNTKTAHPVMEQSGGAGSSVDGGEGHSFNPARRPVDDRQESGHKRILLRPGRGPLSPCGWTRSAHLGPGRWTRGALTCCDTLEERQA